ncbi:MAG: TlpA family protein disulfide reductase [Flavobacteriales bacterium]
MNKILLCILLLVGGFSRAQVLNYQTGAIVPDFTVTDLTGQTQSLYNYTAQGKYVVLDFFAYWCTTCAANAPVVDSFYRTYGCNSGDVVVIGIELEGSNSQALTFEANAGLPEGSFPVASGIEGGGATVHSAWGVSSFPTIVAISPNNTMLNNDIWPLSGGASIYSALQDSTVEEMECMAASVRDDTQIYRTLQCFYSSHQLVMQGYFESEFSTAQLVLHDMTGKMVATTSLGHILPGKYFRFIEIAPLPHGIYAATLQAQQGNIKLPTFWVR